jgi:hypothetical protein
MEATFERSSPPTTGLLDRERRKLPVTPSYAKNPYSPPLACDGDRFKS